jgi:hypothetical protein
VLLANSTLGAEEETIKRFGLWANSNRTTQHYLSNIPIKAIGLMSGFGDKPGFFYLPRVLVIPFESLQETIFPDIEEWLNDSSINISGMGFLQLLIELRVILLQEAVLLRSLDPNNALFLDPVFKSQEFEQFARLNRMSTPSAIAIESAVSHLYVELQRLKSNPTTRMQVLKARWTK